MHILRKNKEMRNDMTTRLEKSSFHQYNVIISFINVKDAPPKNSVQIDKWKSNEKY
jgi:hypothetical protein